MHERFLAVSVLAITVPMMARVLAGLAPMMDTVWRACQRTVDTCTDEEFPPKDESAAGMCQTNGYTTTPLLGGFRVLWLWRDQITTQLGMRTPDDIIFPVRNVAPSRAFCDEKFVVSREDKMEKNRKKKGNEGK